ncbi:hypothetical protein CKO28_12370 [Rhodovibrio sodomensis]|uniref:Integrase n=1 Tax=Rhodovibrio sodomensis TaxID=1088 RepID=A0ABS1DFU4_9PROT|nr:hypothetical protein [Rhodovibrio sodomensis]
MEPTIAKRLAETAPGSGAGTAAKHPAGPVEVEDGRLWRWVARYAPADRWTQRALHRTCRNALKQMRGDPESPAAARLAPERLAPERVERTIDRYLAQLLGVGEPSHRRARLKVHAMMQRKAPVDRPAALGRIAPEQMAGARLGRPSGPLGRLRAANANRAPDRGPAPLLPPEAPLEMPEQDLS